MRIKAKSESLRATHLQVPIDGLIEIDSKGYAEVSDKCGEMLINGTNDWENADEENRKAKPAGAEKTAENEEKPVEGTKDEDNDDTEGEKEHQPTDEEIIEGLNAMSLEDCIKTAKEAGYPKKEWEKLSKNEKAAEKLMRAYLVKKYKESVAE